MPPTTPKFAERIDAFAGSLIRFGVATQGAYYQAHGLVHMLLRYCERNQTDWLGDASSVDGVLGWDSPPQVIAPSMAKAGLLVCANGEYICPYVWDLCCYNVKKKWCEEARVAYDTAKKRRIPVDNPMPANELTEEPERDLFGEPINANTKKSAATPLGYRTVVDFWLREWSAKYSVRYTFRPKDGATIKRLLSQLDATAIQRSMQNYLACGHRFYAGHELSGLYTGINKWSAADRISAGEHGVAYAGAEEDLPTAEL